MIILVISPETGDEEEYPMFICEGDIEHAEKIGMCSIEKDTWEKCLECGALAQIMGGMFNRFIEHKAWQLFVNDKLVASAVV